MVYLNEALVAWRMCRGNLASASSCESELQGATLASQMLAGITAMVESMDLQVRSNIHIDNQATLRIINDNQAPTV